MEEKIVLDKDTFKALSVESRINILKLLTTRNHTLTEIAESLELSNSTVKEHLDVMVKADLVKQIDSGHKWKYYKLSFKGKNFIQPKEVKVLFAFAISAITAIGATFYLIKPLLQKTSSEMFAAKAMDAAPIAMRAFDVAEASGVEPNTKALITLTVSLFLVGLTLGYLIKKPILIGGKK